MRVTIIGAGAMGGAIGRGLLRAGFPAKDLTMSNPSPRKLETFGREGVTVTTDNREATRRGELIILAVKPWIVPEVIEEIKDELDARRHTLVSVAAGVSGESIATQVSCGVYIVIPNTAAVLGQSMTFITLVRESDTSAVKSLFGLVGEVMEVEEKLLPAATTLASCGIAYAMRYIRAAMEGGVELGFRASAAQAIVAQTVKGAAALVSCDGAHPETEIDKVTTPGGLTIRGLNEMERAGFTQAVIRGLKAGVKQ
ncbi:MAG: pyrroline-5-carboxylate reductase [Bacteroides sp.]|nr:pyrroline-5-carboxylate reductase [Bacteroides sp.]